MHMQEGVEKGHVQTGSWASRQTVLSWGVLEAGFRLFVSGEAREGRRVSDCSVQKHVREVKEEVEFKTSSSIMLASCIS